MIDLTDYGLISETLPAGADGIPARITAVHKERYALICRHGETYGRLKTSIYFGNGGESFPTAGDFVLIIYNAGGDSQIIATLERKTFFSRRDPDVGRGEQAVAANFDYVFIMQSLNHNFNANRLERYITLAWQSGAVPVIVLTKADLVSDHTEQVNTVEKIAAGVNVYAISAVSGYGMHALAEYLQPRKTIVFLGSSGVGKSSLVNALVGADMMAVKAVREDDGRGRHTTTHRQMVMLDNGVMLIDTPGMRELGIGDVSSGLGETFSDVEQYFGKCRFTDCKHQNEPGCAVQAAVASGELPSDRWKSYQKIRREAKYADKKDAQSKMISKTRKQKKNTAENYHLGRMTEDGLY